MPTSTLGALLALFPLVSLAEEIDADLDGFAAAVDCDDGNPAVNPGATEVPDNGIDDDCEDGDVSLSTALVVNEILYDPASGAAGDANGDGTRDAFDDEFVELVNVADVALDLSGISLWDADPADGGSARHVVPMGTVLQPAQALVVFGGGTPTGFFGDATVQTASTGTLSLNNSGEEFYVADAFGMTRQFVDTDALSNNPDESYTLDPDLFGAFSTASFIDSQHGSHSPRLFSPGTKVDLAAFDAPIAGTGSFAYFAPGFTDKPVNVYYHFPASTSSKSPIVFLFHPLSRIAEDTRDAWIAAADTYGFVLVAPGFNRQYFPNDDNYNFGGLFVDGDAPSQATLRVESDWSFSIIEPLFDEIAARIGSEQPVYHAWGHSAGAQFLHRLVEFLPDGRYGEVIPANSGWYTLPDPAIPFPYGFGLTPAAIASPDWFGVDLTVHIGSDDNDPNAVDLRRNTDVDLQGTNRYDRAYNFLAVSEGLALAAGTPFAWDIVEVAGVAHDESAMATFAGAWLADRIDPDGDGVDNLFDNCPTVSNADQTDANSDGFGDACVAISASISSDAVVDPTAIIGDHVVIRNRAAIGANVVLEAAVRIGHDADVGDGTTIGTCSVLRERVYVGENVQMGSGLRVGHDVAVGDGTTVGDRTRLQDRSVIGFNAQIGSDVLVRYDATVADDAVVPDGAIVP